MYIKIGIFKGIDVPKNYLIEISRNLPDLYRLDGEKLKELKALYQLDAKQIADALFNALPGGTLDALLIEILSRKESLLAVAHGNDK